MLADRRLLSFRAGSACRNQTRNPKVVKTFGVSSMRLLASPSAASWKHNARNQCTACADGEFAGSGPAAVDGVFCSRDFMYSSYCAVPGRGGASGGNPPAQAGIRSAMPPARKELIEPQPPRQGAISMSTIRTGTRRVTSMAQDRLLHCGQYNRIIIGGDC